MIMKNGFVFEDGNELEFVGAGQLSIGAGLELDQRFAYDFSRKPQAIVRRKRKTARTATVTLQISRAPNSPEMNLFDIVSEFEDSTGKVGGLYWNARREGTFCIRGTSFSCAVDAVDIVSSLQVSLELVESYQRTNESQRERPLKIEMF